MNNPFMWERPTTISSARDPGHSLAWPIRNGVAAIKSTPGTSTPIAPQLVFPLELSGDRATWGALILMRHGRVEEGSTLPDDAGAAPQLRPPAPTMTAEFLEWYEFVRCICLGRRDPADQLRSQGSEIPPDLVSFPPRPHRIVEDSQSFCARSGTT